jgi:hypothetical protein
MLGKSCGNSALKFACAPTFRKTKIVQAGVAKKLPLTSSEDRESVDTLLESSESGNKEP